MKTIDRRPQRNAFEKMTMSHIETALSRFAQGYNCSQTVLSAYAGQFGFDEETAMKISSGFGGGMGRMGDTCGVVTGAFMVLGLKYGQNSPDREAKETIYARIKDFAERFKKRNGSLACRVLLGCDISTPEGLQQARKAEMFSKTCPKFLRDACEILEEMLNVNQE
jgi:C_GCAxxG_C_C family probable redox protein